MLGLPREQLNLFTSVWSFPQHPPYKSVHSSLEEDHSTILQCATCHTQVHRNAVKTRSDSDWIIMTNKSDKIPLKSSSCHPVTFHIQDLCYINISLLSLVWSTLLSSKSLTLQPHEWFSSKIWAVWRRVLENKM